MHSEFISQADLPSIEWDENYFKFCAFDQITLEGGHISSDFNSCTFTRLNCYWTLLNQCNFLSCTFADCIFQGVSFADTRFIECTLTNCQFLHDNLGSPCEFSSTVTYGCSVLDSPGFPPNASEQPRVPHPREARVG